MNCQNHPEVPATAYCRSCGKAVCDECRRDAFGTVFCAEHVPAPAPPPPPPSATYVPPPPPPVMPGMPPAPGVAPGYVYADVSPGLALFLGMIPGVGAIYNGQYAKGLVHAVVFGILVSIADKVHGAGDFVFGMMAFAWWAYMVFEAYHTARKRRMGEPVDEYSSVLNLRAGHNVPLAGVALIVLGVLLLLETLNLFDFEYVARYWPVLLIAAGAYLLYGRFAGNHAAEEVRHERQ
jgi:TM2 domain-containing membrane protein YozV